ncbi:MAG: hypothetical protein Q7R43_04835 [Candidatus Daviesbacteria bacterium]|nr:hypothetical protein [Candidatus Daviesbacteria bacterium]
MDNQKLIVESLAMDLKRVSLGLYRGSNIMANRFKEEALKRSQELENQSPNDYLKILIQRTKEVLKSDKQRVAEDALMYSTLFQNFALNKMESTNERR